MGHFLPHRRLLAVFAWTIGLLTLFLPPLAAQEASDKYFLWRANRIELPVPLRFLDLACRSGGGAGTAYCLGYLEAGTLIWTRWAACKSPDPDEQAFCAGANAAETRLAAFMEACDDCSYDSFRPEDAQDAARSAAFLARMAALPDEVAGYMGGCPEPDEHPDAFCKGYDKFTASRVAEFSAMYRRGQIDDPGLLGQGHGSLESGLHLFGTPEFYATETCLTSRLTPEAMRDALLSFLDRYPDQARVQEAMIVLGRALHDTQCGPLDGARPHVEACLSWHYEKGEFVAHNLCEMTVILQFMARDAPDKQVIHLSFNSVFHSGLDRAAIQGGWWMYTACPLGYESTEPLDRGNPAIATSNYACVPE